MDTHNPTWSPFSQWTGGLDERGLASFQDMAMARSPLRRVAGAALPAAGVLPLNGDAELIGEPRGSRGRPGKGW
jgi:hypothetical protein